MYGYVSKHSWVRPKIGHIVHLVVPISRSQGIPLDDLGGKGTVQISVSTGIIRGVNRPLEVAIGYGLASGHPMPESNGLTEGIAL